jgi:hypothetical protein
MSDPFRNPVIVQAQPRPLMAASPDDVPPPPPPKREYRGFTYTDPKRLVDGEQAFEAGVALLPDDAFDAAHPTGNGQTLTLYPPGEQPHPLTHGIALDGAVTGLPPLPAPLPIPARSEMLNDQATTAIESGFLSAALSPDGQSPPSIYFYPSDAQSQIFQSQGGQLLCRAPGDKILVRRPHTEAQRQQVVGDFVSMRDTVLTQLDLARADLAAVTTMDQIEAVTLDTSAIPAAARRARATIEEAAIAKP